MADTLQLLHADLIYLAAKVSADGEYELTEKLLDLADFCESAATEATA